MGIGKKRTSLRTKSVKKTSGSSNISATTIIKKREIQRKEVIPLSTDPNETGISKSAIRRRKRKAREQLQPKFSSDMLDALTTSTGTVIEKANGVETISIPKSDKILDHAPNPFNNKGERAISKIESTRFKEVLKTNIKGSSLRDAILLNMTKLK